ncbi:phosphatidate cytidylyltransferase [Hydrogenophaga sp. OTU3427]|uniref:phosphatidate cytidylyltransferase n=1 Tax=Hydrogenophaga sp. OTU3427 TaxID=3043856 RepID=UPI00313E97B9
MLKQRVITALVLLAFLLPALFYREAWAFNALMLAFIAAGGWEWGRLNRLGMTASLALGAFTLLLCVASWLGGLLDQPSLRVWLPAGVAWVVVGAWLLRAGVAGWPQVPAPLRLAGGVLALWLTWLAVAQARVIGINFLLSVLVLVWVADIFAYFAGRAFGTRLVARKLAPAISPGKSWEGVMGGMAGVLILALVWAWADGHWAAPVRSFYSHLANGGTLLLVLVALGMAAMSVVGDLVESLIKRSVGAKDSSGLLPGHGGVLDRVDALLPTLPLAMMFYTLLT